MALRKLASEQDLQSLQYNSVETPVTQIVERMRLLDSVCGEFGLTGGIEFYDHMNPLSNNVDEVAQRLEAQELGPPTSRPRPDLICVYTMVERLNKPAMVVEYKAPHKLTLAHLRLVLDPNHPRLELDSIINEIWVPLPKDPIAHFKYHTKRLVAAIVAQTFSYMVQCGTQYGYITTGEGFAFLYIKPEDNAKTVYYHLAEPNEDVNAQKEDHPNTEDYLHRSHCHQPSLGFQCPGSCIRSRKSGMAGACHRNPQKMGGRL